MTCRGETSTGYGYGCVGQRFRYANGKQGDDDDRHMEEYGVGDVIRMDVDADTGTLQVFTNDKFLESWSGECDGW